MNKTNRRDFLTTLAAAGLYSPFLEAGNNPAFISFSTLGCPKWDWLTILGNASKWGFSAIELRGIQGEMDLTKRSEFQTEHLKESLAQLKEKNLRIIALGSSARMHEPEAATRSKQLDEGRRFIDLAHALRAPYVRVFGDKYVPGESKEATIDRIAAGLQELGNHAKSAGVTVLIESHGDFNDTPTLLQLLQKTNQKTVALLWDAHHTCVAGKEDPAHTCQALKPYIRHVHLKDSKLSGDKRGYVLTGQGDVPVKETVRALVKNGYKGYYNLEWEKAWAPEIAEPEIAFPHFAKTIREYLAAAKV